MKESLLCPKVPLERLTCSLRAGRLQILQAKSLDAANSSVSCGQTPKFVMLYRIVYVVFLVHMITYFGAFFCRSEYDVSTRRLRALISYWCHVCCLRLIHTSNSLSNLRRTASFPSWIYAPIFWMMDPRR